MLYGLILILVGLLAAYPWVVAKVPKSAQFLDKIKPYQGWIGVIVLVLGIFTTLSALLNLGLLALWPVRWLTLIAVALLELALGFLLGYDILAQHLLSSNPDMAVKGAEWRLKIQAHQTNLGFAAIILGVWAVVVGLMY